MVREEQKNGKTGERKRRGQGLSNGGGGFSVHSE
jgi:hypothetical protein